MLVDCLAVSNNLRGGEFAVHVRPRVYSAGNPYARLAYGGSARWATDRKYLFLVEVTLFHLSMVEREEPLDCSILHTDADWLLVRASRAS